MGSLLGGQGWMGEQVILLADFDTTVPKGGLGFLLETQSSYKRGHTMGNKFFMGVAALAAAGSVFGASNDCLGSSDEKGSLLIFSNVIGTVHMSNDYPANVHFKHT